MTKPVHAYFDSHERWHGKGYGCVWKHATHNYIQATKKYVKVKGDIEECDYRKNGYDISLGRTSLYNKSHYNIADNKGYISSKLVKTNVEQRNNDRKKPKEFNKSHQKSWKQAWQGRLNGPIRLLSQDPNAWHIDHIYSGMFTPWWGQKNERQPQKATAKNFLPQPHGGIHFFFPYKHNYHHLISRGSFHNSVLNAPVQSDSKVTPYLRLSIVLCKKYLHWNINNENNIILLPNEEIHADIVGLPAHCPWNRRSHPIYSFKVEKELVSIRERIDKAIETEDHEAVIKDVNDLLEDAQTNLYNVVIQSKIID